MSDETTEPTEEAAKPKKNRPRHITMMEREYERVCEKYEHVVVELANVARAQSALSGKPITDDTVILASCAELAKNAMEDAKNAEADGS